MLHWLQQRPNIIQRESQCTEKDTEDVEGTKSKARRLGRLPQTHILRKIRSNTIDDKRGTRQKTTAEPNRIKTMKEYNKEKLTSSQASHPSTCLIDAKVRLAR